MRIGAKLPDFGATVYEVGPAEAARRAEEAGFDSVWVSDHVVMVEESESPYPYSPDGSITWEAEAARLDAIVAMAMAAASTERVTVGVAILLAGLRNPLILAKQIATLDAMSRGRIVLGVGAGWLAEEFEALGVPFDTRGERLDEWIEILRQCWTGRPSARSYRHYEVLPGLLSFPTPGGHVPIIVGGMSPAALRRAGRLADGWLAFQRADALDMDALVAGRDAMREHARIEGKALPSMVVRLTGPLDAVAAAVPELAGVEVDEVIIETDWLAADGPERTLAVVRRSLT